MHGMRLWARLFALLALALSAQGFAFAFSGMPLALRTRQAQRLPHARVRSGLLSCRSAAEGPGTYALNVNLYVKEERREEFLQCILANQKGTMTDEPLAVFYDFGESDTERNTFHFQEQYLGREGFEAHTKAPHFAKWEEFASTDPFTKPPEVMFFKLQR